MSAGAGYAMARGGAGSDETPTTLEGEEFTSCAEHRARILDSIRRSIMLLGQATSAVAAGVLGALAIVGCSDQARLGASSSDAAQQLLRAPSDALVDKLVAADVAVAGQPASDGRIFKSGFNDPTCQSTPSEDDSRGYRIDCQLNRASTAVDEPIGSINGVELINVRPTGGVDGLAWSDVRSLGP